MAAQRDKQWEVGAKDTSGDAAAAAKAAEAAARRAERKAIEEEEGAMEVEGARVAAAFDVLCAFSVVPLQGKPDKTINGALSQEFLNGTGMVIDGTCKDEDYTGRA